MNFVQKLAVAAIVAMSLVSLLLFAYLGLHSRPMSDDYCHILTAGRLNFLDYLLYWRAHVDGSFSDYIVRDLLGPLGFEVTRLFPAIVIGVWLLSTAALLAKCLDCWLSSGIGWSLRFCCRYHLSLPSAAVCIPKWCCTGTRPA